MKELPIVLRLANQEDVAFIFNSWLKSYKTSNFAKGIEPTVFYSEHHKLLERLLKNYDTIIACSPDDSTQIYGFINGGYTDNFFTLNYVYVKHTFRRMGIAKSLFNGFVHEPGAVGLFTHLNHISSKLSQKYNMMYHPYIMFNLQDFEITKNTDVELEAKRSALSPKQQEASNE